MSTISRRRVAVGAAWAVPVIVVGAAAPALAASGCPTLVSATGTAAQGTRNFDITLTFSGIGARQFCVSSLAVGGPQTFTQTRNPCFGISPASSSVTVNGRRPDNGNNFRGRYTGAYTLTGAQGAQGLVCTGQVSFTIT